MSGRPLTTEEAESIAAALASGDAIVCLTRCEPCMFGCHYEQPQWHSWAGPEDVAHALATGQVDPSGQRCGCSCASPSPTTEEASPRNE